MKINEISNELRNRYVSAATDDQGKATVAGRIEPGQERRVAKRAAGMARALDDRRWGQGIVKQQGNK